MSEPPPDDPKRADVVSEPPDDARSAEWHLRARVYRARRKRPSGARFEPDEPEPPRSGRTLRRLLLTVLSMIAAYYLWTKFQPHPAPPGLEDVPYVEPGLLK